MKKLFILLLSGWLFGLSSAMAQADCSGVYLTANDYLTGKLVSASVVKKRSNPSGDDLLACRRIIVHQSGINSIINKKDIYAVKCCDGKLVRICRDGCYTLLNPGEDILLYKVVINSCGKGGIMRTKYYFSKTAGADIEDLTIANLKVAFQDNDKFSDALDTGFRGDSDLHSYDKYHQCYKLNRIYDMLK